MAYYLLALAAWSSGIVSDWEPEKDLHMRSAEHKGKNEIDHAAPRTMFPTF
jgi:hypothetical protein